MTKLHIIRLFCCFWVFTLCINAQQRVGGIVFEDGNQDGVFQSNEKGLEHILISNGDTIVMTDKQGRFALPISDNKCIFPILPNTYSLSRKGIVSRHFLFTANSSQKELKFNFGLIPVRNKDEFRADIVGDVQVKDLKELDFAQRSIFNELCQNGEKDFALFMGDLSNDNDTILELMRDCIDRLPFQSWNVAGNHDMNVANPRNSSLFCSLYGSDVYAFFRGKACFIVLSNAESHSGTIPPSQLRFLKQLIKLIPEDVLPIVCEHIPLYAVSNRAEFLQTIGKRRCLVLSAHAHDISRHIWNEYVSEWVVGASCGSWWTGEYDNTGVPNALQQCGSPRNYFQLFMKGSDYQLKFKGVGLDADKQMDVWVKGQTQIDDSISAFSSIPEGYVAANIFAGGDSTHVQISIDGGNWQSMQHTFMVAPSVARIIEWNKQKIFPTQFATRLPLRNRKSPHIWTYQLPSLAKGFHQMKIRATDDYGMSPIETIQSFYQK